jgi:lipoate-protein ligase A
MTEGHVDPPTSFRGVLDRHEELLRRGRPAVHVAPLGGTVVSYGVGVPERAAFLRRAELRGIPTVRRPSGGAGVLHRDGDLVWGVVLPRSDPRAGRDFARAYGRLGAGLVAALAELGQPADWVPAPGLSEEYCPLGHLGQVLALRTGFVSAAAQHLTATALLHHGTLSLEVDRSLVADLFAVPDAADVRRLSDLREAGVKEPVDRLAARVARCLTASFGPEEGAATTRGAAKGRPPPR